MTTNIRSSRSSTGQVLHHGWTVVAGQELRDLWLGTRGLALVLGFSVVLSVLTVLVAGNADLNLLDARETVGLCVQVTLGLGTLAVLIISADSISGERERGTLEHLLLTPVRRRDLVAGKLVAALSVWAAVLCVSLPYILVLARGPGIAGDAMLLLLVVGTLVAVAFASLGLTVSSLSRTNRSSLIIALLALLALAIPSQLPASAIKGALGDILVLANPAVAGFKLVGKVIVDQSTWSSQWNLFIAPAAASVILTILAMASSRKISL